MIVRTATSVLKRDDKRVDVYRDTDLQQEQLLLTTEVRHKRFRSSESSQFNRQNEKTADSDQLEAVAIQAHLYQVGQQQVRRDPIMRILKA